MKNVKKVVLIIIVVLCVLINSVFANTGTVNIEAARVRKEATTNSEILTVIYEDDVVEIIDETEEWYKIKYENYTGFVKKEFLKVAKTDTTNTNTNTNTDVNTNTNADADADTNTNTDADTNTNIDTDTDTDINTNTNTDTNTNNTGDQIVENTDEDVDRVGNRNYSANDLINLNLINTEVILKEDVNLKITPSLLSIGLYNIDSGVELRVTAERNAWIQVTNGEIIGWILKTKVLGTEELETKDEKTEDENTDNGSAKTGYVNTEAANVRASASPTARVLDTVSRNDVVTILEDEGDWYKIKSEQIDEGYISKLLITIDNV